MPKRTAIMIARAAVIAGFAISLSACGHYRHGEEKHEEMQEQSQEQMQGNMDDMQGHMQEHAFKHDPAKCPMGGGPCCEGSEPTQCCPA